MAALGDNYATAYNSALSFNEGMYNNQLAGYQQLLDNQTTASDAIGRGYGQAFDRLQQAQADVSKGYGGALYDLRQGGAGLTTGWNDLTNRVLGGIQGIGNERGRQIDDTYTRGSGDLAQSLVSRGLGNSTVQASLQAGLAQDRDRARNALAEQVAGLNAGYLSQLGSANLGQQQQQLMAQNAQQNLGLGYDAQAALQLAAQGNLGLGYQQQALQNETGLGLNQLAFMNSVSAPYPQAGMYANLAQMFGQQQQGQADTARLLQLLAAQGQAGGGGNRGMGPTTVDPRLGVMPGYSRGASGGPPPSSPSGGGGMNFLAGTSPALGGRPVQLQSTSPGVGVGAGAFGQAWGGALGTSGMDLAGFSSGYPTDYGGGMGFGFDGGAYGGDVATAGFTSGGFDQSIDYGAYFPQDVTDPYSGIDWSAIDQGEYYY